MGSLALVKTQELMLPQDGDTEFLRQFIKPVKDTWLDEMVVKYTDLKANLHTIHEISKGGKFSAMGYFLNSKKLGEAQGNISAEKLFDLEGAIAALNADFWKRAFDKTDIYAHLPQKRRDEWNDMFKEHKTLDFTEDAVRSTISDNLHRRAQYLAERVDGIFQNLSREHVTNQPQGFSKRFILGYMFSYDMPDSRRSGFISDLRGVIAMLNGREVNGYIDSYDTLKRLYKHHGKWFEIDGGTLRMKAFLKGTVHVEIHPDIAWKLNQLLAILYPIAIPSKFRVKPQKSLKEFNLRNDLLSVQAINAIHSIYVYDCGRNVDLNMYSGYDKTTHKEVENVMLSIGGVPHKATRENRYDYSFDYDVRDVINEIVVSGYVPDYQSYQFYPTIPAVAKAAIDMAEIGDDDDCLEPSAGTGGISDLLPIDRTTCVEVSNIHCAVLKSKGYNTIRADFIKWAVKEQKLYDRIVMNPPFSEGRAQAHVKAATGIMRTNGVLVAILPASFKGKEIIQGFDHHYSSVFKNCFNNTGASVVILKLTNKAV